jgi:hypothetical protein
MGALSWRRVDDEALSIGLAAGISGWRPGIVVIEHGMVAYADERAIRFGIPVSIGHPMRHGLAALVDEY